MAPSGTSTRIQAKGKCKDGHVSEHRQLRKVGRNGEPATKRSAPETAEAPFARSRAPGRPLQPPALRSRVLWRARQASAVLASWPQLEAVQCWRAPFAQGPRCAGQGEAGSQGAASCSL